MFRRFRSLVRAKDGRLTRELLRAPGRFGLGQVPAAKTPDATTGMVCGFCSTGCGLTVHLREGQAINLSPTTDYPVNRGMACPKGWEALTVLDAPDRATAPLLRGEDGRRRPVDWHEAMATMTARFRAIQAEHGDDAVAFLSTGQIATEEMALLGAVAKFGMGMVHGDGNTRQCMATAVVAYKQAFGFDAPPYTYQGPRRVRLYRPGRGEPLHRPPGPLGAGHAESAHTRRSSSSTRAGPRRRWRPRFTCRSAPSPTWRSCTASRNLLDRARLDRPALHRRPHARLRRIRGVRPPVRPGVRGERDRPGRRNDRRHRRADREGRAGLVLVDDGGQPEPSGRQDCPGHHQPGPHDRQHRPAGDRGQLDHRPVQRDGLAALLEHDEPARRARLHRPRPPRRGRRAARHPRGSHPPTPKPGRTTRSSRASARARSAASG